MKLMLVALMAGGMLAQDQPLPKPVPHAKLYWYSTMCLTAGTAFDAATSWGRLEANPLMRSRDGRFGAKAGVLHVGYVVGTVVVQQRYFKRRKRAMRAVAIANFAAGGLLFGFGASNLVRLGGKQRWESR